MNDDRIFAKCAWRLVPLALAIYLLNYLDRVNVGFAALTMNRDLGFSPEVFGFGAGVLFFGYSLFQVPANAVCQRVGTRRWLALIMFAWGLLSAATAFVREPLGFSMPKAFLSGAAAASGIAFFNTLGSIGRFLGPYVIGLLRGSTGDYAAGMLAIAAACVLSAGVVLVLQRSALMRAAAAPSG